MCAPLPPQFDTSGTDKRCAAALAAYAANTSCLDDGGIANMPDAADASDATLTSADATAPEAGPDAASDATHE
jgi:hypothetical protein